MINTVNYIETNYITFLTSLNNNFRAQILKKYMEPEGAVLQLSIVVWEVMILLRPSICGTFLVFFLKVKRFKRLLLILEMSF